MRMLTEHALLDEIIAKATESSKNIERSYMPQISGDKFKEFSEYIKSQGIAVASKALDTDKLNFAQCTFNKDKILNLDTAKTKPVLVSNDGYILDGNHRVLSNLLTNKQKTECVIYHKPFDELLPILKSFHGTEFRQ